MLIHGITPSTICGILNFAREQDLTILKDWCLRLFPNRLGVISVTPIVEYLQREENERHKEENDWMKEIALDFVLENLYRILTRLNTKKSWKFYADFLLPYISQERIAKFTELFKGKDYWVTTPSFILSDEMAHLRDAIFNLIFRDFGDQDIRRKYGSNFYNEYFKYALKRAQEEKESALKQKAQDGEMFIESKADLVNESNDGVQRKAIKRMDPVNSTTEEEGNGPTLKKTKQSVAI